jgi:FeS assembly SUF system protein
MTDDLKQRVIDTIKTVYDPEIPVNIWEVGLIYGVEVDDDGRTTVTMTLTSPMCPVAESLPVEVEQKVNAVEGVTAAKVDVVWDPPWSPDMMSEAAQLELGLF